jgi:hypothetical protein
MKYEKTSVNGNAGSSAVTSETAGLPCIGRLVGTTPSGAIAVRIGTGEPRPARLMAGLRPGELSHPIMQDREVLVMFEQGDPEKPIILGLLADPLEEMIALSESQQPKEVMLDGKRVTLEAQEEIQLKCGDGSITLRKDGKIIIKGTHLLSRASGPNRIKGGSVQIN